MMRAFVLCVCILLFPAYGASASEYKPGWSDLPCQICVEKLEETGVLNIRETRIVIDDKQALLLTGGQAGCVFVSPGRHFLYADSFDPYDPDSENPKAWSSNRIAFILEKGQRAEFEIRKALETEENRWEIRRVDDRSDAGH